MKTTHIRVCVATLEGDRILLVPHYYADGRSTRWYLPGGKVEWLEPLETAVRREFLEETGLRVGPLTLLDVCESLRPGESWHSVTVVYRAQVAGGALQAEKTYSAAYGDKTPRWFAWSELPELPDYLIPVVKRVLDGGQ